MTEKRTVVLASTSPYRKQLLERLGIAFETAAPHCDETPLPGEMPGATALRLALAKAHSLEGRFADELIIGSDQVAASGGLRLGQPGNHENAVRQLRSLSGREVEFHTAVCLLDTQRRSEQSRVVPCRVAFRELDEARIERYLQRERPYDCAASAKAEGLGIALLSRIETDDPTSLIGLPLIALSEMLERAGFPVF